MKRLSLHKRSIVACVALLIAALAMLSACATQASPSAASSAKSGQLETSDAPALVVPNVVSLTLPDAEKAIVASGLKLGDVKYEASETVPTGAVVSQDPKALTQGEVGKPVALVVSSGHPAPKEVKVPDVTGMHQADAEKALSDAKLLGICAGSEENADTDPGLVFKQSIEPGSTVTEGTKVTFTIASAPTTTKVPNVIGLSEDDANAQIRNAGLSFDTTSAHSDEVDEGLVMNQSYNAGTEVQLGTTVTVTLSLGPAPVDRVPVPYVLTYSWSEAEYALESAGLVARYTGDPAGVVVDQDYDAGTIVDAGTVVTLVLASADDYIEVPSLVGMSVASAETITDNLGLSLDGENHGTVIDQVPAAGTMVERGTTISIKVDDSDFEDDDEDLVEVPDVTGMSVESAYEEVEALGLSLDGENHGTVVDQAPAAGTMLERGETVSVKVDTSDFEDDDEDLIEVPDLTDMSAETAFETVDELGLSLDGGNHGTVVDQVPEPGTMVEPGSTISVELDTSDFE